MTRLRAVQLSTVGILAVLIFVLKGFAFDQGQVTAVGIVAFRDESGANAPFELREKIAADLRQDLNKVLKDTLVARALNAESDRTVEQLGALAKQDGIKFVVRGGLLSFSARRVELSDLISVESGTVTTLRAEGEAPGLDAALSAAIGRLSISIHDAIVSATASPAPPGSAPALVTPPESSAGVSAGSTAAADEATAEAEEALWQLIAQAEAMLRAPAGISTGTLDAVRQALGRLNASLEAKATLVAKGEDSSRVDSEIAIHTTALQSAMNAATEQAAAAEESPTLSQEPSAEKRNILSSIGEYLGQAGNVLQEIQAIRALWQGAREDATAESASPAGNPELPQSEEPIEDVSGVVTEDGAPVEGVTVTEEESGATATTDRNGSFVLRVVPGKPSRLILTRKGKRVAIGRVHVQRGRPAVADFELKLLAAQRVLRVTPSTIVLRRDGLRAVQTGRLAGVVRDSRGRPQARALVALQGVAVARTDSQGRYTFIGVPAGSHQLTISRAGVTPQTITGQIGAGATSQSSTSLASTDRDTESRNRRPVISRGARTLLRGVVTDTEDHPLTGAKVTVMFGTGAVSVLTAPNGSYVLRDVEPGDHRTVVTKFGYVSEGRTLEFRSGSSETRNFTLRKTSTRLPADVIKARPTRTAPSVRPTLEPPPERSGVVGGSGRPAGRSATGEVHGQVVDAKTGSPLTGAVVSLTSALGAQSNRRGSYTVSNVPPGLYQVVVKRNGYIDGRASITIRAGEAVTLNLRLMPRAGIQLRRGRRGD